MELDQIRFDATASDTQLVEAKNAWLIESRSYHDEMLMQQRKCLEYYLGNQTRRNEIPLFNSNTVYNRIFEATETIVPITTGSAHQFLAIPGEDSEVSIENAKALQKVLARKYTDLEVQKKLETIVRDMILKRFGVMEWGWDNDIDDLGVWTIDPKLVLIPRLRCPANKLPYVMVVEEYTLYELKENFPGFDVTKLTSGKYVGDVTNTGNNAGSTIDTGDSKNSNSVYVVLKVLTDEYWAWMQGDIVLKREPNPYWDFEGEDKTESTPYITKKGKPMVRKSTTKRFYNHLDKPTKNLIFFAPFTTGDSPVANTSLAEIAIPIQDDINVQKRQISNNLVRMGNGQVYIDSDALPQEIIDQITSEPGLTLVGKNLASENRIRREPGVALPSAHFANLAASIAAFDNIFGTHGGVRGNSESKTLGGQVIDRQQDLSRIDQITRELNHGMNELADGLTQLMKLFYDTPQVIRLIGKDGSIEFMRFTRDRIDNAVVIETKSGTPIMLDPQARSNRAIQLWQLGGIDPESFFEELSFADPQDMAKKLMAYKNGQLLLESQIKQEEAAAAAQAGADANSAVDGGGGGMPMRKAETPNDAAARATRDISGAGRTDLRGVMKTANT